MSTELLLEGLWIGGKLDLRLLGQADVSWVEDRLAEVNGVGSTENDLVGLDRV
jgi:hypothetical protein